MNTSTTTNATTNTNNNNTNAVRIFAYVRILGRVKLSCSTTNEIVFIKVPSIRWNINALAHKTTHIVKQSLGYASPLYFFFKCIWRKGGLGRAMAGLPLGIIFSSPFEAGLLSFLKFLFWDLSPWGAKVTRDPGFDDQLGVGGRGPPRKANLGDPPPSGWAGHQTLSRPPRIPRKPLHQNIDNQNTLKNFFFFWDPK